MTDDVCVQNKLCVQNWISAEFVCVCNYMYGLIPTKPEDVCLTLIQSQRLLGVSASTICVCMYAACISASVPMSRLWLEVHSAQPRAKPVLNKSQFIETVR